MLRSRPPPGRARPVPWRASRSPHGADLIVAAGGDGTINEVAEGMVHTSVPLGILPAGTANVLAMEMKLGGTSGAGRARASADCGRTRISVGHLTCDGGRCRATFC